MIISKTVGFYTVSDTDEYSVWNVVTDEYEASITKHFECGTCTHVWLAYSVGDRLHVAELDKSYRGKLSAWQLCHAEDMARRYIQKQQTACTHPKAQQRMTRTDGKLTMTCDECGSVLATAQFTSKNVYAEQHGILGNNI